MEQERLAMGRLKELGIILKRKYDDASQGEKVTQIYLFAISHAKEIQENNYRAPLKTQTTKFTIFNNKNPIKTLSQKHLR